MNVYDPYDQNPSGGLNIQHQEKQDRTNMSDAIVLVQSSPDENWFTIQWKDHDGREWLEPIDGGAAFEMSCRISDACVEGTLDEMQSIAQAIRDKDNFAAKRCSVAVRGDIVFFESPRNSQMLEASELIRRCISYASALDLADQIDVLVQKGKS